MLLSSSTIRILSLIFILQNCAARRLVVGGYLAAVGGDYGLAHGKTDASEFVAVGALPVA